MTIKDTASRNTSQTVPPATVTPALVGDAQVKAWAPPVEALIPSAVKTTKDATPQQKQGVTIRMYRQGLGDCFLVTLPGKDQSGNDKAFHIVIDCGVVLGTNELGINQLQKAVQDIAKQTKGQIDLLVLTHEHWDHVSGFKQAQNVIQKEWTVKQVWTAWTEDPKDTLANKLSAERKNTEDALRLAMAHMAAMGATSQLGRIDSLVGFMGATAGATRTALDSAKALGKGNLRFCLPGEDPIVLPELPYYKFYILGPPKNEALLRKSNPGTGEAYGLINHPIDSNGMFLTALKHGQTSAARPATDDSTLDDPFEARFQIPSTRAQHLKFFTERYFGEVHDDSICYFSNRKTGSGLPNVIPIRDQSWRRIDGAWLDTSESLALALDAATNNTSLVIAIEIVATGEVLLFPGDAQAGNWLSWQDLAWPPLDPHDPNDKKVKRVTGPELLARTVFYKVGHHGSHNATLQAKGLELMTSDALTAMIPVDHDMAVIKRWGKMPLEQLVARLHERTKGRVLRIDDPVVTNAELATAIPKGTDAATWEAFVQRVQVDELFFELTIPQSIGVSSV